MCADVELEASTEPLTVNSEPRIAPLVKTEEPLGIKQWRMRAQKAVDALNGCLCGEVVSATSEGTIKCKFIGCETQWVRLLLDFCV